MENVDQRAALERLIQSHGSDYAGLSRMLGRNAAYIQQFIKRGIPRKLDEEDRGRLARFFGVGEDVLGGPIPMATPSRRAKSVSLPRLDVGASAGPGSAVDDERTLSTVSFDERWLRAVARGVAKDLSLIRVDGDSMEPTLSDGDEIMVDRSDAAERLRDGIYVLRRDDVLIVKRIAVSPSPGKVTIKSDNGAYSDWPDISLVDISIIGRAVWAGRKLR